ncbi:MAG: serine hydrolase [Oligoflexia bacterium]|nr:serine hydrolase [Oligoflexia bacterium]
MKRINSIETVFKKKLIVFFFGLFLGGIGGVIAISGWNNFFPGSANPDSGALLGEDQAEEAREGFENLINPLLDCPARERYTFTSMLPYKKIEEKLQSLVDKHTQLNQLKTAGIYVNDLHIGSWFGINARATMLPGSLVKLPLVVGHLRAVEANVYSLDQKILFNRPDLLNLYDLQLVRPTVKLEVNQSYTLQEIMRRSIVYSDNVAAALLEDLDNRRSLDDLIAKTHIPINPLLTHGNVLTLKEYSGIFRILYNASFLSDANSSLVLQWLTQADFVAGISAGIPAGTVVAHKFGEAFEGGEEELTTINDCGIIYYSPFPYLLCVSLKGKDPVQLATIIKEISTLVYQEFAKRRP